MPLSLGRRLTSTAPERVLVLHDQPPAAPPYHDESPDRPLVLVPHPVGRP